MYSTKECNWVFFYSKKAEEMKEKEMAEENVYKNIKQKWYWLKLVKLFQQKKTHSNNNRTEE